MRRILVALVALALVGCDYTPSADDVQNQHQEQMTKQAVQEVGMPAITRFSEKRQLRAIFELRDQAISTTTYIVDLNGGLHKFCDSVGYGIPYATQYTSPQKQVANYYTAVTVPQADPNGLYSPPSADGTWVLCLNPKSRKTQPVYVEPRVVVSPFELHAVK